MPKQMQTKRSGGLAIWLLTPPLLLLLSAGICLLGFTLAPTHTLQKYLNVAFMDDLKTTSVTAGLNIVNKQIHTEAPAQDTYQTGEIIVPSFGEQYAVLECKDVEMKVGVYFGSNAELLALGACQASNSAILGMTGNVVIDAHVNTYFSDLPRMEIGNTVTLYTEYGRFTYRVIEQLRFHKSNSQYVRATEEDCLTLYTCEAQVLGNSDMRIGVRCELVSKEFYQQVNSEGKDAQT